MIIQFIEVKNLFDEYDRVTAVAQDIATFTRDIELQKTQIALLFAFIEKSKSLKDQNKSNYSPDELNLILSMMFCVEAVLSELQMVVNLKENKMDNAWAALVYAQIQIGVAAKNHPFGHTHLDNYVVKLESYEKLLFPSMMFASAGYIIRSATCSICGLGFDECDHLKGKFYSGELCVREIREADLEEGSLVDNPASKLCRVISKVIDGKKVDVLTLKEIKEP